MDLVFPEGLMSATRNIYIYIYKYHLDLVFPEGLMSATRNLITCRSCMSVFVLVYQ